jgi:hypothetical protein
MLFRTPLKGSETAGFWPIANGERGHHVLVRVPLIATTGAGTLSADARRRPGVGRTVGAPQRRVDRVADDRYRDDVKLRRLFMDRFRR